MLSKRDLNKIRRHIDAKTRNEILVQSGYSFSTVEKVLLGIRKNEKIIQLSINLSSLAQEQKESLFEKLYNNQAK